MLSQALRLLQEGLMQETFAEVGASDEAITAAQFEVLRFIDRHERPTIGELAEGLKISSAAATKAVAGLEERPRPLVTRSRGADRRTVLLDTTPAGNGLVRRVRETFTNKLETILDRLEPRVQDALEDGLRGFLAAALHRARDCDAACLRCGVDHTDDCVVQLAELRLSDAAGRRC